MQATIPSRKIGIEIEVVVPIIGRGDNRDVQDLIASILTNQGLCAVARNYTRQELPADALFAVEHDTSLCDEHRYPGLRWSKVELKTAPMPWNEIERVLPPALDVVRYCGARVNHSCGLHVHHHLPEILERPTVVRNLQHLWWRFHPVIYGLVAPSRRNNQYCRPPRLNEATRFDRAQTLDRLCQQLGGLDRFTGLNLQNLSNRQRMTVEWRLHSGTTEWSKIRAWVLATQRWVEHAVARSCHFKAEPVANSRSGLNSLLITTGLKPNSRIYRKVDKELRTAGSFLLKRWQMFNQTEQRKAASIAA